MAPALAALRRRRPAASPANEIKETFQLAPDQPGVRQFPTLRMALSVFAEQYYLQKNVMDHAVEFVEQRAFSSRYLPWRLKQYAGQKRIAFLIHGWGQARTCFELYERLIGSELFRIFSITLSYRPYSQDIRLSAEQVVDQIGRVLKEVDVDRVFLIGHSQGGLIIRTLLQSMGWNDRVSKAIFLSTPHQGTWAGLGGFPHRAATWAVSHLPFMPRVEGESAIQMLPGSRFLGDLNARPLPETVEFTSLYNLIDPMVWPAANARLPYEAANNILVRKIGHLQSLYNPQEIEIVLRALLIPEKVGRRSGEAILARQDILERKHIFKFGKYFDEFITASD